MTYYHKPVLLDEALNGLNVLKGETYIDATIGGGGHTQEILKRGGKVLGIDQDQDSILHLKKKFESEIKQGNLILAQGNFAEIEDIAHQNGIKSVKGILLDLGLSSYQLDESGRGFSFRFDEGLDMRMDTSANLTAADIVNTYTENELTNIFLKYGEMPNARKIAQSIVAARRLSKIKSTGSLVQIISGEVKKDKEFGIHPATRIFQAIRIEVNNEIGNLKLGLDSGFKLLEGEGRLAVISFHSLEDRVVKLFFQKLERDGLAKVINKKPITAGQKELEGNRRARSAKLRIIEKIVTG